MTATSKRQSMRAFIADFRAFRDDRTCVELAHRVTRYLDPKDNS